MLTIGYVCYAHTKETIRIFFSKKKKNETIGIYLVD